MSRRVLHVVDRVTGGVPVAVRTYIENSPPGVDHSILSPFDGDKPASVWGGVAVDHLDLGTGHLARMRRVAAVTQRLRPDLVHAHSSFAGVYARTAVQHSKVRIAYSPHCFSFERRDLPSATRALFWAIESLLGWNTDVLVACGAGEEHVAGRVRSLRRKTIVVPNVAAITPRRTGGWSGGPVRVGMAGRMSAQKDPAYFAQAINDIARGGHSIHAVWIGAPDPSFERDVPADIDSTGWLSGDALETALSELDLYVHSAAWEGFPIAILDAHAAGLPILARPIPALAALPPELTVDGGLPRLRAVLRHPSLFAEWSRQNRYAWAAYLQLHTLDGQRSALDQLWAGRAVGDPATAGIG